MKRSLGLLAVAALALLVVVALPDADPGRDAAGEAAPETETTA